MRMVSEKRERKKMQTNKQRWEKGTFGIKIKIIKIGVL